MIRTSDLTHIHLIVRDMKRSLHFYRTAFGMRARFKAGKKLVFLNTPGSKDMIALHQDAELIRVAGTSERISHFGFQLVRTDRESSEPSQSIDLIFTVV